MYQIITVNGEIKETGKIISLKDAQKAVGGYVEIVKLSFKSPKFMLVDEEARIKSPCPSLNQKASNLSGLQILGDVVVLDKMSDLKG
jgi:hypothetical protein